MALAWIAVALLFAVAEVATVSLFAAFISLGAMGAALVAFAGLGALPQALAFGAVAFLGIALARPWVLHRMRHHRSVNTVSGAISMLGETALVVRAASGPQERGHVRIWGENWPARSRGGSSLEEGATVRIVDVDGATLVVEPPTGDASAPAGRAEPSGA
jgi:membrane protein implicated in regulation of membrane protease activity